MFKAGKIIRAFSAALAMVILMSSVFNTGISSDAAGAGKTKKVTLKIGKKTVTKKTYSMKKGKKAVIKVKVSQMKAKRTVSFQSSNKKTASVSKKGAVLAKKKGTAKITVAVKEKGSKTVKTWVKIRVTGKVNEDNDDSDDTDDTDDTETDDDNSTTMYTVKTKEVYMPDGDSKVYGKIYMPDKEGTCPAIIMSHGYNGANTDFVNECNYFARNGYVACAIDFCGGSARSKSSGKTTETTIFTEKSNVLATYRYIKELENVDKSQIYLFGGSQGGLVTAMAAEEVADEVKGMILYFPAFNIPDDWRKMHPDVNKIPETIDFWGLKLGKVFAASMHDYYTFDNIGSFSKKVLILYGKKDAIVPYSYIQRAEKTYKDVKVILYPNDGHGFTPATGIKAREEVYRFMSGQEN